MERKRLLPDKPPTVRKVLKAAIHKESWMDETVTAYMKYGLHKEAATQAAESLWQSSRQRERDLAAFRERR